MGACVSKVNDDGAPSTPAGTPLGKPARQQRLVIGSETGAARAEAGANHWAADAAPEEAPTRRRTGENGPATAWGGNGGGGSGNGDSAPVDPPTAPPAAPRHPAQKRAPRLRERYDIGEILGHGRFAVARDATDRLTGERVAIKTIAAAPMPPPSPPSPPPSSAVARREARVLRRAAGHPNVVRLREAYFHDDDGDDERQEDHLVLELASKGEAVVDRLFRSGPLPERSACAVARALLSAVAHLHARGVAHRDIKLENLLLRGPDAVVGKGQRRGRRRSSEQPPPPPPTVLLPVLHPSPPHYQPHHPQKRPASPPPRAQSSPSPAPSWRIGAADAAVAVLDGFPSSSGASNAVAVSSDCFAALGEDDHDEDDEEEWVVGSDDDGADDAAALERRVVLADFGLAVLLEEQEEEEREREQSAAVVGTSLYLSPELAARALQPHHGADHPHNDDPRAADVWACGVVAFALLTARTPCWAEDDADVLRQIVAESGEPTSALPASVSPAARAFVRKALTRDPAARPTAAELLATDAWLSRRGGGGRGDDMGPSPAPSSLLPSASSLSGLEALIDDVLLGEGRRSARRQRRQQEQERRSPAGGGGVVVAA
jgi:serine/threonine protein kinase